MEFEPGRKVGSLLIERELGRGAYGVVYLARDTLLGRSVALKVVPGGADAAVREAREQFLAEARLVANLESPHIVTLYRLHESEDGGFLLEMEYAAGGSLEDRLGEDSALELSEAVRVFRGLCRALADAHEARVIHGDVKPANILFDEAGQAKLADFGVARLIEGTETSIALEGRVFGSPLYMAPEVITGRSAGMSSDVWSAAVLFQRTLTGGMAFPAQTFPELLSRLMTGEPEPPGDDVPAPLAELIGRCFAKEAEERPTAAAILEELDRLAKVDIRFAEEAVERGPPTNLPPATTSFVGRGREIGEIAALLADEAVGFVTLAGPGGMGKTRLSMEVSRRVLPDFPGGAWFVDLSETFDRDGVGGRVAETLGVPHAGEKDPVAFVASVLQYREPMLLVLDNFEQVVKHAGATVGEWRRAAPHVRMLVTSRASLGLPGERRYDLSPLAVATETEGAEDVDGVRLFTDRAREADPGFATDEGGLAEIVRIVSELNGIPLAIELAAARARIMGPRRIAENLSRKFQLLRTARLDVTVRQRTLLGAIEWSFDLLAEWEKDAYLQAAWFRGGISPSAAERVIDLSAHPDAPPVLEVARSLRDQSLLTARDAGLETRLGMYPSIREYGAKVWRDTAAEDRRRELGRRHAEHFLAYAEEWDARVPGYRAQEAFDRIGLEVGNLEVAQEWAIGAGEAETAARTVLAAAETMRVRHPPSRIAPWLDAALGAVGEEPSGLRVRLLTAQTASCRLSGDWEKALASADRAVGEARGLADPGLLARALLERAEMLRNRGELDQALEQFAESAELAKRTGERHLLALAVGGQGMVRGQQGDFDEAFRHCTQAEMLAREVGDHQTVAVHLGNRGVVYENRGELAAAIACHREAEDLARKMGDRLRAAVSLGLRANAYSHRGDLDQALACYLQAERIARELGAKQRIAQIVGNRGATHKMADELDQALECFLEAEELARGLGDQRRIATTLVQRARVLEARGQFETAVDCYRQAEQIAEEIGDAFVATRSLCNRGTLYAQIGRLQDAWEALSRGVARFDEMKANESVWYFTFKSTLAGLAESLGRNEVACELARDAVALAGKLGIGLEHPESGIRDALAIALRLSQRNGES